MPAFSAMRRKPSHNVRVPNSSTITSTDSLAMAKMLSTIAEKIPALPPTSHWASADTVATRKKLSHRPLSIGKLLISAADDTGQTSETTNAGR
jgi:hypothetical protein